MVRGVTGYTNTTNMETSNNGEQKRTLGIALATVILGAIGTTGYLMVQQHDLEHEVQVRQSEIERVKGEERQLKDQLEAMALHVDEAEEEKETGMARIAELERLMKEAEVRAALLQSAAAGNTKRMEELAEARRAMADLRSELDRARTKELDLRADLDRANNEKEALAHRLDQNNAAALMVNNAELAARQGKKGKLTVKARRTNEVHMAFDLPGSLAKGASFVMTSPKGKQYNSADPMVSASRNPSDATASVGLMAKPDPANASRVDLKFRPKEKLEPGVYRIEVRSGADHLQTVYLNLR